MGLDIRLPIGLMFVVFGALLTLFGFLGDQAIYGRSLGININILWGLVMFGFGALMIMLGRRGTSTMRPAESSPEGMVIEEEEVKRGVEEPTAPGH